MRNYFFVFLIFVLSVLSQAGQFITSRATVSVTGTSAQCVAQNIGRKYLLMQNNGASAIYVKPASAHSGTEGIVIAPSGGAWEPINVPIDAFYCKSASGTDSTEVVEGN